MMDNCVGVQVLVRIVDRLETLILISIKHNIKEQRKVVDGLQSAITKPISALKFYSKKKWTSERGGIC